MNPADMDDERGDSRLVGVSPSTNLIERIEAGARSAARVIVVDGDDHLETSWPDIHVAAQAAAARLQELGVTPGCHVAVIGPTRYELIVAIEAVWLCGATLVMMPLPMRLGSIEAFVEDTLARLDTADVELLILDEQLAPFLDDIDAAGAGPDVVGDTSSPSEGSTSDVRLRPPSVLLSDLATGSATGWRRPDPDRDAIAVLQYTSGSTSDPKGVVLPHRALCANLDACAVASKLRHDDVLVSWLPLYHDMGLIGFLLQAMTSGLAFVQGAPQDFLARPSRWMEWMSRWGGTVTAGPNFSYVLATRALRRAEDLDLSDVRIVLNGAEPIDPATFRGFFAAGEPFGLSSRAAFCAFGMAEVCIGGAFPEPESGMEVDVVDSDRLATEHVADAVADGEPGAVELAVLGRPVPGLEFRIVDPLTDAERGERQVGELLIRGTSVTPGYYRNRAANEAAFSDGWLRSGDLAYLTGGRLVMCGRIKDVLIVGGRNIQPQDVERAAGMVEGVRAGNVVAFGIDLRARKQAIVVVAEVRAEPPADLVDAVTDVVTERVGVPPRAVVLVEAGSIPKTSSGKLQRSACRSLYLDGQLPVVAASRLANG